ncbi:MAG: glutathione synthase [Alphaproteobacteria bacterium]
MDVAFQMDHPSRLNAASDSTFMLIAEAGKRGYRCHFFEPGDLSWRNGELLAHTRPLKLDGEKWSLDEAKTRPIGDMRLVWMRQGPAFDMPYITATHLLEHAPESTRVVNDPKGVRNAPEKLSALHLAQFLPPTLISSDAALIHDFAREHGSIVAKPLYGFGGRSVFQLKADDPNIETLIEHWREATHEPLMWQRFLPEVASEDTRVILINGKIGASFHRTPQAGSIRANMRVGGTPKAGVLSKRQQEICEALAPMLREHGLLFTGLDLIGDYLTEINVTSPTGLRAAQQVLGIDLAPAIWDAALA